MKAYLLLIALSFSITIQASTITVVNNNDSGTGSLREALNNAVNGDLINFNTKGVITLSSPLDITGLDITIAGPGANVLAIDGDSSVAIFRDNDNNLNNVTIADLEIRNASSTLNGAAIYGSFELVVKRCYIHSNSSNNGSGIYAHSESAVQIDATTISDNSSRADGAGVYMTNGGTLNIINSTFYNNKGSEGLAFYVIGTDVNLVNVTIAGHNSGVNVMYLEDDTTLLLFTDATAFSSSNSVFDNKANNYSYNTSLLSGRNETSNGYNICNNNTMNSPLYHSTDYTNTSSGLDFFNGLQLNGGTTPTLELLCGSMAINTGSTTYAEDQRGFSRLGTPDRGAVESRKLNSTYGIKVNECEQYTSPSGKYAWNLSGTYKDTIPNAVGCDSLMTIYLNIAPDLDAGDITTN